RTTCARRSPRSSWRPRRWMPGVPRAKVGEVREQVLDAGTRLWRLIEKLLDLSVLEAGRAEPRSGWYSIEEVLQEAIEQTGAPTEVFKLSVQPDMPLLQGDAGQVEGAFLNVLEKAARYTCEEPGVGGAGRVAGRV